HPLPASALGSSSTASALFSPRLLLPVRIIVILLVVLLVLQTPPIGNRNIIKWGKWSFFMTNHQKFCDGFVDFIGGEIGFNKSVACALEVTNHVGDRVHG
ncbi:hypothetical protein M8C21_017999, partial [Ambrosia artemisiifolia]